MAAFMEKRNMEAQNEHSFGEEILQSHFSKASFPHLQFSGHQVLYSLTEPFQLTSEYGIYSARTAPALIFDLPCVSQLKSGQRDKKKWGAIL